MRGGPKSGRSAGGPRPRPPGAGPGPARPPRRSSARVRGRSPSPAVSSPYRKTGSSSSVGRAARRPRAPRRTRRRGRPRRGRRRGPRPRRRRGGAVRCDAGRARSTPVDRLGRETDRRGGELAGAAREREHRAPVVGVGVDVQAAGLRRAPRARGSRLRGSSAAIVSAFSPSDTFGTASRVGGIGRG